MTTTDTPKRQPTVPFPKHTFDIREDEHYLEHFGEEALDAILHAYLAHESSEATALPPEEVSLLLRPWVLDDTELAELAVLVADRTARPVTPVGQKYDVERLREIVHEEAIGDAFVAAAVPSRADIDQSIAKAVAKVIEEGGLMGVDTDVYWCGVLFTWPWADMDDQPDEDTVVSDVLRRAEHEDGKLTLTYAGSPWTRKLRALAKVQQTEDEERKHEPVPLDLDFGQNLSTELLVMARAVFHGATDAMADQLSARFERVGVDPLPHLRRLLSEHFASRDHETGANQ